MRLTFLGTGTSQGIPVIGSKHPVCLSNDLRDKRLRTSAYIEIEGKHLVIDTGPDFRQQMLNNQIQQVDAVLYTHEHRDHTAGFDDIRPFNFMQKKDMPLYCSDRVGEAMRRDYAYVFEANKYPGAPGAVIHEIENKPFQVEGISVMPIEVMHMKLPVFGFRINDLTYITDAKTISPQEKQKILGSKVLVLNCLRTEEHYSHFNLAEALSLVEELKPEQAYFTHISHLLGFHEEVSKSLPNNVKLAYDGLQIEI
ncbi:MAG: phosphoribosyl 1,2-cyclic phosphate phosphodiesterase [Salibacteraceae bacterium]|jgi:phosphoribosyl 1,2-cyclic phosphate phosphodiesterase|tara:strand:- start:6441 stop:7202 length:762 start_codon:yes stop_codon:yes gene_type:complete